MEKERYKLKTQNKIGRICVSTVILFIGIILVYKSFVIEKEAKNYLYSYNLFQNVNYTVALKENNLFKTETLGMDKAYVSELVDKINMDFTYSLKGNKKGKIKYNYQIIAATQMEYDTNDENSAKVIWEDQELLLNPKDVVVDDVGYTINESVVLNYAEYNEKIKEFSKLYKVPVKAKLEVKLFIISESEVDGVKDIIDEYSIMNVKMDLNETVFTVNKDFKPTDKKEFVDIKPASKHVNKFQFGVGIVIVVIALIIMLDSIRKSIKFSKKSDYAIALNRILKNYGDIVAEIVSPIEVDNLNVIEVKNFDQLLDIEEEIRMPILFYEIVEGESGEFIIVCDNMAYRYGIGR